MAQGCRLSTILLSVLVNDLFKVEQAELEIPLGSGNQLEECCLLIIFLALVIQRKACRSLYVDAYSFKGKKIKSKCE